MNSLKYLIIERRQKRLIYSKHISRVMRIDERKAYWDNRYSKEGKIWGELPSQSALYCLELFKKYKIKNILIPGSGYGRHTKLFSNNGYHVMGIEISETAFEISKKFDHLTNFLNSSVLEMEDFSEKFDAIFCFNTLHLFLKYDRLKFLNNCYNKLNPKGIVFFTAFSEKEDSIGKGKEKEKNTFESKPGRPTHYFTEVDLVEHFKDYTLIEQGLIEEQENHGERGPHTHYLRYIFAQK
ncbi:MAG: class I SAM-dependent methyltransferase [Promethearchaeota archaeon]